MLNIGTRLMCAASMVECCRKIVDIGTDHAYLPSYLVLNGKAEDVLACDIGVMPLKNAEKTVNAFELKDKIALRISDGLKSVSPDEADEIIICGMGGNLIVDILSEARWIKRSGMHLILQPMTHSEDVRRFLCKNGFSIAQEKFVVDNKKIYCCISAHYTGNFSEIDPGFYYFGFLPPADEVAKEYVQKQLRRVNIKLDALKNSDSDNEAIQSLQYLKNYCEARIGQ